MTITIDSDTESFARRLARVRGETIEEAVAAAVRAELARAERTPLEALTVEQEARVERTMAMVAAIPPFDVDTNDSTEFLYDERGLPH